MFQNSQDELAHYVSLWDAAQEKMDKVPPFRSAETEEPKEISAVEILQERRVAAGKELDFRDMLLLSEDVDRVFHPERYHASKQRRSDVAMSVAASANPIEMPSAGRDQKLTVTRNFTDGEALRELSDLKIKIESLERKFHGAEITGTQKQENSLNKELASLRSKIEELSNMLSPANYEDNN